MKPDEIQPAPQEQSCWEKRVGRWRGGAEEEARQVFTALAVTMRLWLDGFSTLEHPIKEKEDQHRGRCDDVAFELEDIFHRTSDSVVPEASVVTILAQPSVGKEAHVVTSWLQPTATLPVAPADNEATDRVADSAHDAEVQEIKRVLENSESTGSDLDDAAHVARDLADKLRADGNLEAAAEMEKLALQLDAAAELKIPIKWPDQDGTLLSW